MTTISPAQIRNIIMEKQLSIHRFLLIDPINPRKEIPARRIPTARKIYVAPVRAFFQIEERTCEFERKPFLSFELKFHQVPLELLMKSHSTEYQRNH
jgi:hypothetical protein